MADWQELVRQRLTGLALDPRERDEVVEELAAHLEETYEDLLQSGVPDPEAAQRALALVGDWNDLWRKIYFACRGKDTMTNRVKQFWIPGLVTFWLSGGILTLMQSLGLKAWIVEKEGGLPIMVLYVWWLIVLPLVGALGAYLSWRAGGSQRAIFSSILFPVLPFLASILIVLPVSLIFDQFIAHSIGPLSLVFALFAWVLAPGAALLAGGLPTRFYFSRRLTHRGVASH